MRPVGYSHLKADRYMFYSFYCINATSGLYSTIRKPIETVNGADFSVELYEGFGEDCKSKKPGISLKMIITAFCLISWI